VERSGEFIMKNRCVLKHVLAAARLLLAGYAIVVSPPDMIRSIKISNM
jgi:hypothetical protein